MYVRGHERGTSECQNVWAIFVNSKRKFSTITINLLSLISREVSSRVCIANIEFFPSLLSMVLFISDRVRGIN